MPRPVSPTLEALLPSCETQSTVDIVLRDGTPHYFSTNKQLDLAETYLPRLIKVGELKETIGQSTNRVSVQLSNVDDDWGIKIASDLRLLELADVQIKRLYRDLENPLTYEHKHFFTGKLVNAEAVQNKNNNQTLQFVNFDVISDMSAAGTAIAQETLSPHNGWINPEPNTGQVPGTGTNTGGTGTGSNPCFIAGTLILTPNGERAIEAIRAGDTVQSFNASKIVSGKKVLKIFEHDVDGYFELKIGRITVYVTPEHRFFTPSGDFKAVGEMRLGNKVCVLAYGNNWKTSEVQSMKWINKEVKVYNFHVEENQTYFANRIAVHNRKNDGPGTAE